LKQGHDAFDKVAAMKVSLGLVSLPLIALLALPAPSHAETCGSAQTKTDKGAPATTGNDGVAGTGWTGGTGGLMAGVENEKPGQNPEPHNPNVAKGLDPTKDKSPSAPSATAAPGAETTKPKC
jgi:hypothetical protein